MSRSEKLGYQWQKSLLLLADLLSFGFETNIITCPPPRTTLRALSRELWVKCEICWPCRRYNAALSACAESSSWEEPLLLLTDLQDVQARLAKRPPIRLSSGI